MDIELKIYEDDMFTVKRTVKAETAKISYGVVRKFMKLFNVDEMSASEILKTVTEEYEKVSQTMSHFFPDVTEEEWDSVPMDEILLVIVQLVKWQFSGLLSIPQEKH